MDVPNADFDPLLSQGGPSDGDAEAALEALRVAIGQPSEDFPNHPIQATSSRTQSDGEAQQTIEKALAALSQLSSTSQTILDNMNLPAMIQGLSGSLRLLVESNRRQADIVRNLVGQLSGSAIANIDPCLMISYVTRAEYDTLRARYEALLATSSGEQVRRTRPARRSTNLGDVDDRSRDGSVTPLEDRSGGRKKRSMKLEHLVHKMANRRLGVEYAVTHFEVTGSRDLPDPESIAPSAHESVNGIQEYRPDFRGDLNATSVRPYVEAVVEDCVQAWEESVGIGEPDVDRRKITEAVNVYWTRLCKRYDEQLTRERGEVHKDEITRRKQNQYRRQQSLLARRVAAFDQSPLNVCRLRALYRTLLTIDFAAQTQEKPDPNRNYTELQWRAYQKLAGGKGDAHEVIDQFWLSNNVRTLLTILDVSAIDQAARSKRKGRPKQPSPTFHLPYEQWDRTTLPILRAKDNNGLPVSGASGIILFKFHVDETVQAEHPEWARGLYDNPPLPDEDAMLPQLPAVMNASVYQHLKPMVKSAREASTARALSQAEINEIISRPSLIRGGNTKDEGDTPEALDGDFVSRSLESFVALASQPTHTYGLPSILPPLPGMDSPLGPRPGSSIRARKQAKRLGGELPGGAATPVAKRRREEEQGEEVEVEGDLRGDGAFLDSL